MPSLWKRDKSPYWVCCYTNANGQRLKKSTKQRDRKKALEVCLAIERAENQAKNGTLTEQAAKKIIGEILERTTGEPLHNYKAQEWMNHWLDMKAQVRSGKTLARYRQVIRDFIRSLGNRANLALAHITPKDILTYRNSIIAANKTARTANLSVKVVSAAFNVTLRQGHIPSNPATALESLPVNAEERVNSRRRRCQSWRAWHKAIGVPRFYSVITPALDLATWQTCNGARLIGAISSSDLRPARPKSR